MTRRIGLTGGIGSGKSSVARVLAARGAVVIDADAIVRELQAPGQPLLAELVAAFGPQILRPDGALDRAALADIVFRDDAARRRLNALVHPKVGVEMARREAEARAAGAPLVVLDVPLLLERGPAGRAGFDVVVVVWVPAGVQLERTLKRDDGNEDDVRRRIAAQMPLDEKRALADFVIDNSGTPGDVARQIDVLWPKLLGVAESPR